MYGKLNHFVPKSNVKIHTFFFFFDSEIVYGSVLKMIEDVGILFRLKDKMYRSLQNPEWRSAAKSRGSAAHRNVHAYKKKIRGKGQYYIHQ